MRPFERKIINFHGGCKGPHMQITRILGSLIAVDTIEKFTTATGIKTFADVLTRNGVFGKKKDCGCNKRKDALNKAFPYKK